MDDESCGGREFSSEMHFSDVARSAFLPNVVTGLAFQYVAKTKRCGVGLKSNK
jgi:hypothetical protein